MNAEQHLEALRSIVDRFREEYEDAVSSTLKAREELERASQDLKGLEAALETRKTEVAATILTLDEELDKTRDAVKIATVEKRELLENNATLKIENARLDEENRKYRTYETQANKVLHAKDESLKARAKEITETEILLANKASFLPKTE